MTTPPESPEPSARAPRRRGTMIAIAAIVGAAIGLGAVYGIGTMTRNPAEAACRPAVDLARRLSPLVRGEVAAVTVAAKPLQIPDLAFRDGSGAAKRLSDWGNRTILLNLWATWCVPCRQEMPALEKLQVQLGSSDFEVVAINIDSRDTAKPRAWLDEVGIKKLGYYADATGKVFTDLKLAGRAFGMPTTLLIDPKGCEIASLAGPAEWASPDALRLVTAALGRNAVAR